MGKTRLPFHEGDERPMAGQTMIERAATRLGPMATPMPQTGILDPDEDELDLRKLWSVIINRRWTILLVTLIVLTMVLTVTYLMIPTYRANLTLQIDREDIRVVKIEGVAPDEATGTGQDYYQTQYGLLKSRNLAQRVIDQLDLVDRQHEVASPSLLARAKTWLASWWPSGLQAEDVAPPSETARKEAVITAFLENLTVAPIRNSRLVKLSYDSPNPELAANALNALARTYIDFNLERRYEASSYARDFLHERLQQLKTRLEESEREMVEFASRQGIVTTDESQNIVSQRLTAINAGLAAAEKQRSATEAVYRQMLETRGHGLSQVLESKIIQTLKESKAKLDAQYQDNLKIFKPAYPAMVQLRGQIEQIEQQINREVANIRGAITAAYESAKTEEALLSKNLNQLKRDVLEQQSRSIQLNILRREVDTNRELYNGLLQRYKEIGVAAGVGTNNISVVDEAKTPIAPDKPKVVLNALLALLLGLLGGVGMALLREHLDDTFKQTEDVEKALGLPVLGMIPLARRKHGETRLIALMGYNQPDSPIAEAHRSLCTTLAFSTHNGLPRSLA
ncbi:MAG: exopolysaccharide biosynthesis protein, partial [Candidatus Competibacter sp.]|nr:exopolysaccharide biosynthesis protein [Candidatus Competibacter sp.]